MMMISSLFQRHSPQFCETYSQTTQEGLFRLARGQSHVVATGQESRDAAHFVQTQLLANTGETA